jgi:carboxypeptidase C (cathepsin A)
MMQHTCVRVAGLAFLLIAANSALAQTTKPAGDGAAAVDRLAGTVDKASVTYHEVAAGGESLHYRATAADMQMKDEAGKLKATIFFVAYDRLSDRAAPGDAAVAGSDGKPQATSRPSIAQETPETRPITFVFNGGPGAAAVWLHIGTAGPRRIKLGEDGFPTAPPHEMVDNQETWLTFTDLVCIDPVGTGFSRVAEGEKGEQFYGVTEDIKWVSEFIRLYLTNYRRWSSPKLLAGESYGTTRAAGLSDYLVERHGIALNGIILISSVLSFQTISFSGGNDLPYVLYLPTYAAIAKYHHRLGDDGPELEQLMRDAEKWAITDYAVALAKGDAITPAEREQIAGKLAGYTGLPVDLIERSNLRISPGTFQKELLADRRQIIGRFDGRTTGFDLEPAAGRPDYDPSLAQYLPIYTATFNDYVRRQLKYDNVLTYEVLSDKVRPWKYGEPGSGYLTVVDDLRAATAKNPFLKIMFASGYYDLATPHFATWYTINHLDLGHLRASITDKSYLGGHMMYHYAPARAALQRDIAEFVRTAVPQR